MILFNKEKDLILRILNLSLIVAILISITVLFNGFINLVIKEPALPYTQYENQNCTKTEKCEISYKAYLHDLNNTDISYKKQVFTSFLITITISALLIILNKKNSK